MYTVLCTDCMRGAIFVYKVRVSDPRGLNSLPLLLSLPSFSHSLSLLLSPPPPSQEPVTAMTWAHGDQKIFIATKNLLHSLSVHKEIPPLQSLCQKAIAQFLPAREQCYSLVLPLKLKVAVAEVFDPVIQVSLQL